MQRIARSLRLVVVTTALLNVLGIYPGLSQAQSSLRNFALPTPLFAPGSAWNQTATDAAVLAESDQQILVMYRVFRGDNTSLYPPGPPPTTWPFIDVNYDDFSIPIFRAGAGQQSVLIRDYKGILAWPSPKFGISQEGGPVTVPASAGAVRPAGPQDTGADGQLVLFDPDTFMEYDFWQATTVHDAQSNSLGGGQTGTKILEAGAIDFFDVQGSGSNVDTYFSARATGTPLLAGLIVPEDVESGVIAHAFAFAIPGPRNLSSDPSEPLRSDYFYPASTTETDFYDTNPYALAAGQRIRLKQTIVDEAGDQIDENLVAPITRMFLTALRSYGAYLVDGAAGFSFFAEDIHTANLHLTDDQVNELIGQPPGTPLPGGKTKWQIVIEKLNEELELIPFAYGPWVEGQNPATAQITTANFEVVEPAGPTSVQRSPESGLPTQFALRQNYPNPFNPSTSIEFSLPQSGFVTLKVFNLLGQEVATLIAERLPAGRHTARWDAEGLASGVYYYRLSVDSPVGRHGLFDETKQLVLLR